MAFWWSSLFRRPRSLADIALLISDVDGTLVSGEEAMSESTAQLLRAVHARGVQIALASARPYPSLAQLASQAQLPAWIISLDGALLHDPSGTLRFAAALPEWLLQRLLDIASHYAVHYACFTPQSLIQTSAPHIPSYLDDPLLERRQAQLLRDFLQEPSVLFCVSGPQPHIVGFLQAVERLPYSERKHLRIAATESIRLPGIILVEIRLHKAHKGTAARALQQLTGCSVRQTMAIGDYRNDLPLFAVSGLRVAMADAVAELRSKADWVTTLPATEHGVEEVLQRLLRERPAPRNPNP